jgi:ribonuclease J
MLHLTVYGGAGEIGGNKILVEDGGARLLLDFGISYSRRKRFFEEYLKPRTAAGLTDLLVTGVLPAVPGLYRRDLLQLMSETEQRNGFGAGSALPRALPVHNEPLARAVLLSHAHLDHAGHITFLDERIPVCCTPLTHRTLQAIQDSRARDFETEITDFRPRPAYPDEAAYVPRDFRHVDGEFTVGGLECRALPVDHSVLGCAAYLLRTSRGTVLYTGDLRFHGPESHLSEEMLEAAASEGIWMLISEGTRLDETGRRSEREVFEECLAALRDTSGPVVADFAPRDLYRLATFVRLAQETGRRLVILPQDAFLLDRLRGMHPLVPDPRSDPILILKERKRTGTYAERDYATWERPVLRWRNACASGELRCEADRLILALSFWDIQNLIDLGVGPDALYIYSASEPHDEEQVIDQWRMDNWLDLLGVRRRLNSHASGHAGQEDLVRMVRRLAPDVLVPVHTEKPGLWRELVPEMRVVEPEPGVRMEW